MVAGCSRANTRNVKGLPRRLDRLVFQGPGTRQKCLLVTRRRHCCSYVRVHGFSTLFKRLHIVPSRVPQILRII